MNGHAIQSENGSDRQALTTCPESKQSMAFLRLIVTFYWKRAGFILLMADMFFVVRSSGGRFFILSLLYVVFFSSMVALRYLDLRRFNPGYLSEKYPALEEHKRHTLLVTDFAWNLGALSLLFFMLALLPKAF